jgi:hypothetical protein
MEEPSEIDDRGTETHAGESPDLESVMHLIWDRLDAVEAERRRVRRAAAGVAAVVLAIAVLWTGMPGHSPTGTPIVMRDGDGHVRARIDTDPESGRTVFSLVGTDGAPQAVLGTDVAGPMLTFYDKQGSARMRIGLEEGSEAPIVDVVDTANGAQSRVNLVSLRAAQAIPLSPASTSAGVRRVSTRGSRSSRPVTQSASAGESSCRPGVLGCLRWPFRWPPG